MNPDLAGALWLVVTVAVYALARAMYARVRVSLLNPALVTIVVVIGLLRFSGAEWTTYYRGGHLIAYWLGPAVVALGVPLALQLATVRRNVVDIAAALVAGALVGMLVAVGVAWLLGAPPVVVRSLVPRSATSSIAIAITTRLGGIPALSAVVSIVTGAMGAGLGVALLRLAGVRSALATGLALGAAAHGFGTARAADEGDVEGASAGMAMGVVGVLTALLAPVVVALVR